MDDGAHEREHRAGGGHGEERAARPRSGASRCGGRLDRRGAFTGAAIGLVCGDLLLELVAAVAEGDGELGVGGRRGGALHELGLEVVDAPAQRRHRLDGGEHRACGLVLEPAVGACRGCGEALGDLEPPPQLVGPQVVAD